MDPRTEVAHGGGHTLAGRYKMGPLLGRGGMAEVFQAEDLRLGRTVAVKLLRPEIAAQPQFRARFESEARSAATLSHPNVVAIYDTGEEDSRPFIVMECLPGPTAADRIARGPMWEDEVTSLALAVLGGLQAAHEAGLVHRDVKPGNILVSSQGSWKVCDFGIAKALDALDPGLTTTGLLVGTPAYLAPERLAGEPANPASDLYSLGTVLYEALTAKKPFGAVSTHALVAAIQANSPVPLRVLRPDVSPALEEVISRAMASQPADRYPSALAMSAEITRIASAAPPGLTPPSDPTEVILDPRQDPIAGTPAWPSSDAETVVTMPLGASQGPTVASGMRLGSAGGPGTGTWPTRGDRPLQRIFLPLAVLAVLVGVALFALLGRPGAPASSGSHVTGTTHPGSVPTLPPALNRALDNLANQVRS